MNGGAHGESSRARVDADALLERLEKLHRKLRAGLHEPELELYHRAALTLRVTARGDVREVDTIRGEDDGFAVRLRSPDGNETAFAASSGSRAEGAAWALARCLDSPAPSVGEETWPPGEGGRLVDREGEGVLPPVDELTEWLHRAHQTLTADGPARTDPFELCVEVAATVESWVADGGPRASRSRTRAWALMRAREPGPGDRASKPVLVAARRWGRLAPEAWREVLEDRLLPDRKGQPPPGRAVPVLFSPECSALLVHALARTLHAPGRERGVEVGPAWKVYDDPRRPEALFGGTFDDAGFATRRTRLANGNRSCAGLGRQGYLRRASYRDRPSPAPAHLTVSPTKCDMPEAGVVATALDLHPVAPDRWVLAVEGARLERGAPGSALHASFVSISPEDLARRCVGTIGPPRASHLGVESPALLFDRLLLHA